jgi:alkylhydroperoxidase family enzyme
VSGQQNGEEIDLSPVNGAAPEDGGVTHGALLGAFTEAVMGDDEIARDHAREELRAAVTPMQFVDTCAVIGAFNVVDRIADATGIPLDDGLAAISEAVRSELDLARFASSANTLGER